MTYQILQWLYPRLTADHATSCPTASFSGFQVKHFNPANGVYQ